MFENHKPLSLTVAADYLALVVRNLGYLPRGSVVVQAVMNNDTVGGVLRVELNACLVNPERVHSLVRDAMLQTGVVAVTIGVFVDERTPVEPEEAARVVESVGDELGMFGDLSVVASWYVGKDSVTPLDRVSEPENLDELITGITTGAVLDLTRADFLPKADPVTAFKRTDGPKFHELLESAGTALPPFSELLPVWEFALDTPVERISPATLAMLAQSLTDSDVRDGVLTLAASNYTMALSTMQDELIREALGYEHIITGTTGAAPEWRKIDALETLLGHMAGQAEHHDRIYSQTLAMMTWIAWAKGKGTDSNAFSKACQTVDPTNQLPRLIDLLGMCKWAIIREHSWSHYKDNQIAD